MILRSSLCSILAGCSLTLAPDSQLSGQYGSDGGDAGCSLDAAQQAAGCFAWRVASDQDAGVTYGGWSISKATPDGSNTEDCCNPSTCGNMCTACPVHDDATMQAAQGVLTFDSGPETDNGIDHRRDGFTAWYRSVPVIPTRSHVFTLDVVALDASLAITGSSSGTYRPNWFATVYSGTTTLGSGGASWSTASCTTCPGAASDYGPISFTFVPTTATVDVAVVAQYTSPQFVLPTVCSSEVYGVRVGVDWMTVQAE